MHNKVRFARDVMVSIRSENWMVLERWNLGSLKSSSVITIEPVALVCGISPHTTERSLVMISVGICSFGL